ncbi:MAG: NADH-quinone oxidoreductase subunit N [Caldilineae bacterium]|nr:MAG: NADH-quinone oxidoreductase subunit N [Caldilineae bacterium]
MTLNALTTVRLLLPELILLITGFVVVGVDLLRRRNDEGRSAAFIAVVGLLLAALAALALGLSGTAEIAAFTMAVDAYALFFKAATAIGIALVVIASVGYMAGRSRYLGEYYALLVFAALAISLAVSATNLVLVYLGIEFLSITSYVLAGYLREDKRSEEAAVKYFLYGATAGAVMLYGISLLYGATGSVDLVAVDQALQASGSSWLLGIVAIILLLVGFGFKASLVPFHQWAPDTYDGAPTPITAFLSTASKAAGFAVAGRVLITALPDFIDAWTALLAVLSMLTMSVGNLIALRQTSVKRMLAYSSIAHAGYILLGLAAIGVQEPFNGVNGLLIYIFAYLFTNVGAFMVVQAIEQHSGSNDLQAFAGLIKRSPGLALMMTLFLLSLAGIPPTAGFIGKFYVFAATVQQNLLVLAAVAVINAVIAAAYYLNVVRYMFFIETEEEKPVAIKPSLNAVLLINTVMVLVIGIVAQPFIAWASESVNMVIAAGF